MLLVQVTSSTLNGSISKPKGPRLPDLLDSKKAAEPHNLFPIPQLVTDYKVTFHKTAYLLTNYVNVYKSNGYDKHNYTYADGKDHNRITLQN